MGSNLRVINEQELPPENATAAPQSRPEPSKPSSATSTERAETLLILAEIRKILSARAAAMLALTAAFALTAGAMASGTWMSLLMAVSFDVFALVPVLVIAYRSK